MGWVIQQGNGISKKDPIVEKPSIPQSSAQTMNTPGFSFYVLPNNISNSVLIPITVSPQPLAYVQAATGINKVIVVRVSAGWRIKNVDNETSCAVMFKLWRGEPVTGELICSLLDGGESISINYKATSFEHVDSGFREFSNTVYTLTAQLVSGFGAEIVGCLTMTAMGLEL
ncbi:hypothetical protein Desor_4977 [Desulfosporosinus orientis DSM 765]|uniref:Uncharacterized protein n=1 Tax=Desulfosporosinus orientis (strain ATCC 19365 / DSM 765 / NCIMB 8382 / VKM B-1628 / Singapore I) TaxID=768706 RepID=G7WJ59_DESOD|nr:hypothetical protein [Desulfosporosinus orientis]AET70371.1 hypothetical protein Desor_4977 [Desulfosporosinus orientis DSM 765]